MLLTSGMMPVTSALVQAAATAIPLGSYTGTTVLPATFPDQGMRIDLLGSGRILILGKSQIQGRITYPGFVANGNVKGTLTIANGKGSITLKIDEPIAMVTGNPPRFHFKIVGGTGAYQGARGGLGELRLSTTVDDPSLRLNVERTGRFSMQLFATGRSR